MPSAVNRVDHSTVARARWLRIGDPEKVAIWYPAAAGFTKEDLAQATAALERLVAYDRRVAAGRPKTRQGRQSSQPARRLATLPDWVPANIVQVENDGGRGRLVVERGGKSVELRFAAPDSSSFQYVRF